MSAPCKGEHIPEGYSPLRRKTHSMPVSSIVLMLTTEGQEADRDDALALGANDYMVKSFKPTDLLERVAQLLDRQK